MDFEKFLSPESLMDMEKRMKAVNKGVNTRGAVMSGAHSIKKVKVEDGAHWGGVFPLCLSLPFNLFDPDDESFSATNRFAIPGTVSQGILTLKHYMQSDPKLAEIVAKYLSVNVSDLDVDNMSIEEDKCIKLYAPFRKLTLYIHPVQHINLPSLNTETGVKFGTIRASDAVFTPDVQEPTDGGILFQLTKFETALIANMCLKIDAEYAEGGIKFGHPQTECEKEKKDLWKSRYFGNPYFCPTARIIAIPYTTSDDPTDEALKTWSDSGNLNSFDQYVKLGYSAIASIESIVGMKKYDTHLNFLVCKGTVITNRKTGTSKPSVPVLSWSGAGDACDFTINHGDNKYFAKFLEEYSNFLVTPEAMSDKLMKQSVYDYRPMDEKVLMDYFRQDIGVYQAAMHDKSILSKYSEVIAQVNSSMSDDMLEELANGTMPDSGLTDEGIAAMEQNKTALHPNELLSPEDMSEESFTDNINSLLGEA
jgi:hypothetical protein